LLVSIQRSKHNHTKNDIKSELHNELNYFQADQNALVKELKFVENAIEDGATEIAMIAVESVFDEEMSKTLTSEARALRRMVRGLKDLRLEVARARLKNRK
jgi:predicted nuclease with TOPRIM domain